MARRINNPPRLPLQQDESPLVRGREPDGTFRADDPSTPDVNEAYEPPLQIKSKDVDARARPKVGSPKIHPKSVVKGPTFGSLGVHTVSS